MGHRAAGRGQQMSVGREGPWQEEGNEQWRGHRAKSGVLFVIIPQGTDANGFIYC